MKVHERLDRLVNHFANGNKAEFARRLEINRQSLNTWFKTEHMDIEKVFRVCPGVSAEWLLTGEGEMLAENRQPIIKDGYTIPFIGKADLLSGNWDTEKNYIIEKGVDLNCDFMALMPTGDLEQLFPPSLIGCLFVKYQGVLTTNNKYQEGGLYIIKTLTGIFFVEYLRKELLDDDTIVLVFSTSREIRRMSGASTSGQNLVISLPESDILQSAEIVWHLEEHVLVNPK